MFVNFVDYPQDAVRFDAAIGGDRAQQAVAGQQNAVVMTFRQSKCEPIPASVYAEIKDRIISKQ
jgi:hypothetical protein